MPVAHQRDLVERLERWVDTEARYLIDRGVHANNAQGRALARLEVALVVGAHDVAEHAVGLARAEKVSWDAIAAVSGLASRGSAARRWADVRVSRTETFFSSRIDRRSRLGRARNERRDEFRTRLGDIENELAHYPDSFRDKVVLLPCDDPAQSHFWQYFEDRFDKLGVKRLIATHYDQDWAPYRLDLVRGARGAVETPLRGDGDFRSPEVREAFEEADVVVTNPPFSLFREFVAQLMDYDTDFLILGTPLAVVYREVWRHYLSERIRHGVTARGKELWFEVPDVYASTNIRFEDGGKREIGVASRWYTTLDHGWSPDPIVLTQTYSPERYQQYENFDAIDVARVIDIPFDYDGAMGVPVTYLDRHDPEQFEIMGSSREFVPGGSFVLPGGNRTYERIAIRRR